MDKNTLIRLGFIFVGFCLVLFFSVGGIVYSRLSKQGRIVTPLGVVGSSTFITLASSLHTEVNLSEEEKHTFVSTLTRLAPNINSVVVVFQPLTQGRAVSSFALVGTLSGTREVQLDPVTFTDPLLGTYGYTFAYTKGELSINVSLDETAMTGERLNRAIPPLILSVAMYVNTLSGDLLRPSQTDIGGQLYMNTEVARLKIRHFQLFSVKQ